jgi:hypothetical protein
VGVLCRYIYAEDFNVISRSYCWLVFLSEDVHRGFRISHKRWEREKKKKAVFFFVKWKLVNDFYLYKKGCRYTHPRKIKQKQNKLSRCQDDASDKMIVVRNRISACTQDYFIYRAQKTQRFPLLSLWHWKPILKRYYYTLFNIDI